MPITLDGTNGVTTNSGTLISATTIGVGGATPSTSGAGITFPATQSASTDANTLDDYEEGTWTPSIGGNATYGTTWGYYTKIGNIVNCQFRITIAVKGTGNNNTVTGLPFTVYGSGDAQSGSVSYLEVIGTNVVFCGVYGFNTSLNFSTLTAAGGTVGTATIWQNNAIVYGQITYRVA